MYANTHTDTVHGDREQQHAHHVLGEYNDDPARGHDIDDPVMLGLTYCGEWD